MMNGINDELILAARLLLATLFLIFGWRKLRDFPGTVNQMAQLGVPMPPRLRAERIKRLDRHLGSTKGIGYVKAYKNCDLVVSGGYFALARWSR